MFAVDNSIKNNVTLQFDESTPFSTLNMIMMAIRRSQIGYYSMLCESRSVNRGLVSPAMLRCFVEAVLDVFHSYTCLPCDMLKEESYFYLKGHSFSAMFTHDKSYVWVVRIRHP